MCVLCQRKSVAAIATSVDSAIGQVVESLKTAGMYQNSLIVLSTVRIVFTLRLNKALSAPACLQQESAVSFRRRRCMSYTDLPDATMAWLRVRHVV